MAKSRRKKQPEPPAGHPSLDEVVEKAGLKPASEIPTQLSPPEPEFKPFPLSEQEPPPRELVETPSHPDRPRPSHDRNGEERELPTFAEKIASMRPARPTGPRKRDGEPAASFASEDLRIVKDGHMWQVEARRELTGNEKDRLAASGFHAVDDDEKVWNATQKEIARRGTDVNHIAFSIGKHPESGRGR
jgi:hypothetical protein